MGREDYARYAKSWSPPDYTVDDNGKVVGGYVPEGPNNWGRWGDDGRYEFMLVAPPLNIPGAVGSPLNPIAIK
ncbi:MAG: hypothetical protein OXG34_04905 [bacterium]|nr:hypothetical protein [bacterium]MCY4133692.1 hypothetical protein [bacterium]